MFGICRAAPSPTPSPNLNGMPPVPNRFRHPDVSATSDDEMSNSSGSRRSSSNDDQVNILSMFRTFYFCSFRLEEPKY